jgi:PAS domain S-box-containing protein
MSLRTKIVLIFMAFLIVPGFLFTVLVYSDTRRSIMDVRIAQLNNIADLKKNKIETFFNTWKIDIIAAQHNPDIRQYLPQLIANRSTPASPSYRNAYRELEEQLGVIRVNYGYLNILLTDTRGRIVFATGNSQGRRTAGPPDAVSVLQAAKKDVTFSDIFPRGGHPAMIAAAPVYDVHGAFAGEILLEQDMENILLFVSDPAGLGQTGEVVISRREGDAVLFLSPLRHAPGPGYGKKIGFHENKAFPSQKSVQGESGSGISFDYEGREVLAAWQFIPMVRWGIVTKIDVDEAFAPVDHLLRLIILLGAGFVLLGTIVAVATARSVTEPIIDLQRGTEVIGRGDLDHKVGTPAKDEIGHLSRVIDAMTDNLKKVTATRDELNAEMAERKERERRITVTNALLKQFTVDIGIKEYLDAAVARVNEWSTCRYTGIRILDHAGNIPFASFLGYNDDFLRSESPLSLKRDHCVCARIIAGAPVAVELPVMTKNGSFFTNNLVRHRAGLTPGQQGRFCDTCMKSEFASLAIIPLKHHGRMYGAIHIADEREGMVPIGNVEFIEQLALIIGEAVYRFGIEDELRVNNKALQASEVRYRTLIEDVRDVIFTISPEGIIMSLNPAFQALTGLPQEDWIHKHFTMLIHPDDVPFASEVFGTIVEGRPVPLFELRARTLAGDYRYVEFKIAAGRTVDGMILGTARDVTERKQAEEERARLVSAVESAGDAVVITHPATGVIQYVNRAFQQVTGYTRNDAVGRTLHFLESGKHDEEYYAGLRDALARDGVWNGRLVNRKKNGSLYYEDCTVSPVKNRNGEIINYVYIKRDVTEKLRFESIADSVNTMDNIGYVFSGVRHEIGNPINSINMILGILRAKQDTLSPDAVKDYLAKMTEQVGRVEYILRSLKSFNLYETQEPQNIGLERFMDNFLPLINADLGLKGIKIDASVAAGSTAFADPRALQQVLLNIVTNAADAVDGRPDPAIALHLSRTAGSVLIRVRDNGPGIPADKLKDIFRPFYTTKQHGTGLGLVIVKKMLARMNGSIELTSIVGEGTTVDITIPEGTHEVR